MKSTGLGDDIEKFTKATGIKKVVDTVSKGLNIPCGCAARKGALNKMFPYKNVECLNEDEYIYLKGFFNQQKNVVNASEQKGLLIIHNRVFGTNKEQSSCGSCVKGLVETMRRLYNEYEYERESKSN